MAMSTSTATASITTKSAPMEWSNLHDILFLREVLVSNIYETRKGIPERGKVWDEIAGNLNKLEGVKFYVSKRALRDRLNLLINKYKAKVREEDRASGISSEDKEIDSLLEEICAKEEESMINAPSESKRKKAEQDKATAEEMREKALETVSETKKRKEKTGAEGPAKRSRRSTSDAIEFLKEKAKAEISLKEKEFELQQKEESNSALLMGQQSKLQQDMLTFMQQQQQEQHQQLQQQQHVQTIQAMFQQQQIQSQALLTLLDKFASK